MARAVNFRVGRGRATERRKAASARGLLDAMKIIGMTDDERRAVLIDGRPDSDLDSEHREQQEEAT
jgi:hypothetical protein